MEMEPAHMPIRASTPSACDSPTAMPFWEKIRIATSTTNMMSDLPPALSTLMLAWKPTDVKKSTMHTVRIVSSNESSTTPPTYRMHETMAKIRPPMTGAGMQKRSKNLTFLRMKLPSAKATTAKAMAWNMSN